MDKHTNSNKSNSNKLAKIIQVKYQHWTSYLYFGVEKRDICQNWIN